jgi:hypothetical protein
MNCGSSDSGRNLRRAKARRSTRRVKHASGKLLLDNIAENVDGQNFRNVLDERVLFKFFHVGARETIYDNLDACGRELSVGDVFSVREKVGWNQFAAVDLDIEFLLEIEDNFKEVDGFRAKVVDERGVRGDLIFVGSERINQNVTNFGENFVFSRHERTP